MSDLAIVLLVNVLVAFFMVGGLCAMAGTASEAYRKGVEDAYGYITEPFDVKYEAAARILRGRRLPPIYEE